MRNAVGAPRRAAAAVFARSFAAATLMLSCVVGCSTVVQGQGVRDSAGATSTTASANGAGCAQVDALMTRIPSGDDQPVASIPQPSGWKSSTKMTSEVLPFTMGNVALEAGGFTPNVVVTRESVDGTVSADIVFEQNRAALTSIGATELTVRPSTVCGLPAERIEYTAPVIGPVGPHPCQVLVVVVPAGTQTFAFTVTVQSTDPTNATYAKDSSTILDGFQVKPPGA